MDLFFCVCLCRIVLYVSCSLMVTCWEKADFLALLYVTFPCVLSLSHRYPGSVWFYRFLIFAFFLTLHINYRDKDFYIVYISNRLYYCIVRLWSDKRCQSHGMYLYQVMMTLHCLNHVANDAESTQSSIITS